MVEKMEEKSIVSEIYTRLESLKICDNVLYADFSPLSVLFNIYF
jgi:hypothetical protein